MNSEDKLKADTCASRRAHRTGAAATRAMGVVQKTSWRGRSASQRARDSDDSGVDPQPVEREPGHTCSVGVSWRIGSRFTPPRTVCRGMDMTKGEPRNPSSQILRTKFSPEILSQTAVDCVPSSIACAPDRRTSAKMARTRATLRSHSRRHSSTKSSIRCTHAPLHWRWR